MQYTTIRANYAFDKIKKSCKFDYKFNVFFPNILL